jgi:hypothetical protein
VGTALLFSEESAKPEKVHALNLFEAGLFAALREVSEIRGVRLKGLFFLLSRVSSM